MIGDFLTAGALALAVQSSQVESWGELAARVNGDNVAKGFWPPEGRNVGEMLALCHSEISEAADGWDSGTDGLLPDEKVPQFANVWIEIADCMIRLLDLFHVYGCDVDSLNVEDYRGRDEFNVSDLHPFDTNLMRVNKKLSAALEANRKNDKENFNGNLEDAFMFCWAILEEFEEPALEIIEAKLSYNRSRPFKHGKKY